MIESDMELRAYPRPNNDTGIGFHYYTDLAHYQADDLNRWLGEFKALGVSWLCLLAPISDPLPHFFMQTLLGAEIEPVIRLHTPTVCKVDINDLRRLLDVYAGWGVRYLQVYNEPNVIREWGWEAWSQPALVERFMDLFIPLLEAIVHAGLHPLFPPLAPGGDYWDLSFLRSALQIIVARGRAYLFDRMAIGVHNHPLNKPLMWGYGGQARWPATRPYYCPQRSQDHLGFLLPQWYDEVVRQQVGRSLPFICTENGPRVGDDQHPNFPGTDEFRHAQISVDMSRRLMDGELPDYMFNNCFWLLANGEGTPFEAHAWYKADGSQLPAVESVKALHKHPRCWSGLRTDWGSPRPTELGKSLYHYVLFPQWEWGISGWYWRLALEYVKAFRPTCGFNPVDAAQAQYVTVVGHWRGVSDATVESLRSSGCRVERIAGQDSAQTKEILDTLARDGKRFLTLKES
jgi:hypothetical protein